MNLAYCAEQAGVAELLDWSIKDVEAVETEAFGFVVGIIVKVLQEEIENEGKRKEEGSSSSSITQVSQLKAAVERDRGQQQLPRMLYRAISLFINKIMQTTNSEEFEELQKYSELLAGYHKAMLPDELDRCAFLFVFFFNIN